jgi:type IV pilus assembly protein PilB
VHSQQDFVIALMLEEGLLTPEARDRAARYAAENRIPMSEALVATGIINPRDLAIVQATVCEAPFVDLAQFDVDLRNSALLPRSAADKLSAFPLFNLGRHITVGMADPMDLKAVDRLRTLLKADIEPVLCEPAALHALIDRAYSLTGNLSSAEPEAVAPVQEVAGDEEPIVAAVNQIIIQALEQGASDIHLGPDERELHLRYRIDGTLQVRQGPPLSSHPGLVQRLKVMASLDLTQTRRPQDGKFRFQHGGRAVDVRLSVIPTICGENVVLRLLSAGAALGSFEDLGFTPQLTETFNALVEQPHGMILVTGPTGSGKTTTLYTFLKKINTPERHVVTIEDPVEIRLPLVRQVQVNTEIGVTFASALRSILRQDPDVILVGEIRDEETARIAVQSALTGHLVLSTLHTNDAPGAIARLKDFGCPPFAINAAVLCALAQRLVKRICPDCAKPHRPEAALLRRFADEGDTSPFRRGAGCGRCLNTGYRGRIGVYEMLRLSPAIQESVERGASTAEIRATALREGMQPLWRDGLDKARRGHTTLEEVARVAAASLEPDTIAAPAPPAEVRHTEMRQAA